MRSKLWLLVALAACGGGGEELGSTSHEPPPLVEGLPKTVASGAVRRDTQTVVLVVVDGLRRDALASYGAEVDVAPNISRLAEESVVFADPVTVTTTANSILATILTGRLPEGHGLGSLHLRGRHELDDAVTTLPELLADEGWETFAAVSLPQYDAELSGLSRGFDTWYAPGLHEGARDASATWYNAKPELEQLLRKGEPTFVLLHLADTLETEPEDARDLDRFLGPFRDEDETLAAALELASSDPDQALLDLRKLLSRRRGSEMQLAWRRAGHASRVRRVDDVVGALVQTLRATGRYDDAAIAVTAPRGAKLQPPRSTSGPAFPPELFEVPLLLRLPGASPAGRIDGVTSLVDLAPTLADLTRTNLEASGSSTLARIEHGAPDRPARLVAPDLVNAATVSSLGISEENQIAGIVHWNRAGERVVTKDLAEGAASAWSANAELLGAGARGGKQIQPWPALWISTNSTVPFTLSWRATSGSLGPAVLDQGERRELQPRGLSGRAEFQAGQATLEARLGVCQLPLRLDFDFGEATDAVEQLDFPSLMPRLRDKGGASWPEGEVPTVDLAERGSGWWSLEVGASGEAGRRVRALVISYPPSEREPELAFDAGPEVTVTPVAGRSDAIWIEGTTPMACLVERPGGATDLAVGVVIDGQAPPMQNWRHRANRWAEPGQLALYVPDWVPDLTWRLDTPRVRHSQDPEHHVWIARVNNLLLGLGTPATAEQRAFLRKLGGRE